MLCNLALSYEQFFRSTVKVSIFNQESRNSNSMSVLDQVRLVIYRVNQKGLEIFLVNNGQEEWSIPKGNLSEQSAPTHWVSAEKCIHLDDVECSDGQRRGALAIEGDWHEIPSIRGIIKQDVKIVKHQIKQHIPELEQGTYFAVKEAVKKVLPEEYQALKELKEILIDRNQAKYV